MKKMMITGVMALTVMTATAQDFKPVLQKTFTAFDTTHDPNVKIDQANKLGLIAKKWDNEWITHYYVALSKASLAFMEKDGTKKDAILDEADKEIKDAVTLLKKENDETYVLEAMIATRRIGVDPMNRWQKYGKIFHDDLESAKEINPNNPRMYYLEATNKLFTPKAYGGGKKAALPYFEKAEGLYAKETGDDITRPYWGKEHNAMFLAQCKKDDNEVEMR
jgi:hypothetical protein